MRVTKTIREYIEESVKKAITESTPMPANEEYKRIQTLITNFTEDLTATMEEYAKKHIADFCTEQNLPQNFLTVTGFRLINCNLYNSEYDCAARVERQARDKRIEDTVKDIVLDLELGGTRTDLEKKLSELCG